MLGLCRLATDTWIDGAFALEQGFIFSAMFLAAATVEVIDRRFLRAAGWCLACSALSAVGLLHAYDFTPGDTHLVLRPAWPFVIGYALMAACFAAARWVTRPDDTAVH